MIGKTISHYKILRKLEGGGMNLVYQAKDIRLNRPVVLKMFPASSLIESKGNNDLLNEAKAVSSLNHPNIVTIHDVGEYNDYSFIVMEYIDGKSLRMLLKSGPLSIKEALNITGEICKSIRAAHSNNISHLDIKPENIMINEKGKIKLLDFGLSKYEQLNSGISKNTISGTIEYMSPERFQGENGDHQSDIFSIGIIIYEMLTGTYPFNDKHQAAIIYNILNAKPIPSNTINPQIPDRLNQIIDKCLIKEKKYRYAIIDDLISDIDNIILSNHDIEHSINEKKQISSIAVLPFEIIGKNEDYKYIGDGIAEDIIDELSKIKKLSVASRISSFKYKDDQDDINTIGEKLKVKSILKGSIQKINNQLRFVIQLINTKDTFILWSEKYDSNIQDILNIKDKITSNIIQSLRIVLTVDEASSIEKSYTDNANAYDYYLRGRSYFHQMRRIGIESAIDMYSKAIKIDHKYTLAYSGLADCYSFIHLYWESDRKIAEKALTASIMAVKLDNKLAEAHVAFGLANSIMEDYDKSENAFKNAQLLNPYLFEAYYFNARIKFAQGKINNALFLYEKACQVQPDDYQAPYFLATIYKSNNRKNDANIIFIKCITNAENQLHINPTNVRALYMGAAALVHIGQVSRGLEWAEQALRMDPDEPATYYNISCTYTTAGEIEKGLDYLDKAINAGFARKDWMKYDSDLDPLRDNPKFELILKKLK